MMKNKLRYFMVLTALVMSQDLISKHPLDPLTLCFFHFRRLPESPTSEASIVRKAVFSFSHTSHHLAC